MSKIIKSKPICGKPVHRYFTGSDNNLRLKKYSIFDITPPISEPESLFILVTSGIGLITINGVEFSFENGSFTWLQSYHTFTIEALANNPLEISVFIYDYPLSSFLAFEEPESDTVDDIICAPPVIYPEEAQLSKIQYLFDDFEKENENYDPGSSLIKVSILGQLSAIFIKNSDNYRESDEFNNKPLGWKAILYMSSHFGKDITAKSVTKHFDSSIANLNRELRNISGYNFAQTLNSIRVNISSMALLCEGMPLSYVATHSGFNSEADFYRTFKKQKGVTPVEYRNQLINNGDGVYRGMIMENDLMKVLNYRYSNFSSPINITTTSKDLYISESVIRDSLYNNFGLSFKELSTLTRIRHAEALLLITDLPIFDIAINVGYNNARSLFRAFRQVHGMTPGEYRTLHLGGDKVDLQ